MAQPTVRQVYALAAALCEPIGEEFPGDTRGGADRLAGQIAKKVAEELQ